MINKSFKEQFEPEQKPYLMMPGAETKNLTLSDDIPISKAFECHGVNYQNTIDSKACLINYEFHKLIKKQFISLNEIEVQQVHNATFDIFDFIDDAYQRISQSHAINFPLRDENTDIQTWYDGEKWLMPLSSNKNDKSKKTTQCN